MFPKIQGLGQILGLLAKIKPEDLTGAIAAFKTVGNSEADLRDRVLAGLVLADIGTNYTETDSDDKVVDFLKDVAETDAIWSIVALVQDLLDGADPKTLEARQEGELIYTGRGGDAKAVPWALIVQVAYMIYEILKDRNKAE